VCPEIDEFHRGVIEARVEIARRVDPECTQPAPSRVTVHDYRENTTLD
jgi:hypothetical protein